ncbi:MAG: UvrD-helicase domain-containing protein, partial [Rhodobacteraceae bacterium]|nr:UvrD-helicase domain-containing protein [Paracoccaceae bacterium]
MSAPDDATSAQIAAADPARSTWVAANAGSGKTRVLTNRVARLLLAGTPPERILCLTFTRAAAAHMQNTLFARLGEWAMLPEPELRETLTALGEDGAGFTPAFIARARTLFARALETPGGLRIQTIHAFCAAVLRRFPLEAGSSPRFAEMDERAQARLRAEILDAMCAEPRGLAALDGLARHLGGDDLAPLVQAIARDRAAFPDVPDAAALRAAFGLPPGLEEADLPGMALQPGEGAVLARAVPRLRGLSKTMDRLADALATIDAAAPDDAMLATLQEVALTRAGEPRKTPLTKPARKALQDDAEALDLIFSRIHDIRKLQLSLAAVRRSLDLHRFAAHWLAAYEARKAALGWLDFDDLILRTRALLSRSDMAQWVLYRLDGAIDHILVDEAQDT